MSAARRLKRFLTVPILCGLLAIAGYLPLLLSGDEVLRDHLYCDYGSYQLPVREFAQAELLAGRMPHWIPWIGCGLPLHASAQAGLAYPLCTPLMLCWSANMAIKLAVSLHVVLGFLGQYRLARLFGVGDGAAAISGLIFAWGGFLTTHLAAGHVVLVFAYCLSPWFFAAGVRACRQPGRLVAAEFALFGSLLLLVGHPQVAYYTFLFTGLWVVGALWTTEGSARRWQTLKCLSTGTAVALLIGSLQLLPMLELVRNGTADSQRGSIEFATTYSLSLADLCRQVLPWTGGSPLVGIPEFSAPDFRHEKVAYLGIAGLLLATIGVLVRRRQRAILACAGLAALGIVIAIGDATPAFLALSRIIPGLLLFRCPGRCLGIVSLFVALLAAIGFEALRNREEVRAPLRTCMLALLLVLAACNSAVCLEPAISDQGIRTWIEFAARHLRAELAMTAAIWATSLMAMFAVPRWRLPGAMLAVLVPLSVDLAWNNLREIQTERQVVVLLPADLTNSRSPARFAEAERLTSDTVRYSRLVSAAVRNHVPMLGTNEGGVLPGATERLYRALETNPEAALTLSGCEWLASGESTPRWSRRQPTLPPVFWLPSSASRLLSTPLSTCSPTEQEFSVWRQASPQIRVERPTSQSIRLDLECAQVGHVVITETLYPGWTCELDDRPVEVVPAFGCFRAIRLGVGRHQFVMTYHSTWWTISLWLAGLGMATLLGLVVSGWRTQQLNPQFSESSR